MAEKTDTGYRLMTAGKLGSGKSSTSNNILGKVVFSTDEGLTPITKNVKVEKSERRKGRGTISIADTPGLFNPDKPIEETSKETIRALASLHPGLDAILFVVAFGRFTCEDRDTFNHLKHVFGDSVVNYIIIIITGGDKLKKKKMSLDMALRQADKSFREILKECEHRVIDFDNTRRHRKRIEKLLDLVDRIWIVNGEAPFKCELQTYVNENLERTAIRRSMKKLKRDTKSAAMEEKTRKAEEHLEDQENALEETTHSQKKEHTREQRRLDDKMDKLCEKVESMQKEQEIKERVTLEMEKREEKEEKKAMREELERMKSAIAEKKEEDWLEATAQKATLTLVKATRGYFGL